MAFPTTSVLDDFNRSNGALGSNWTSIYNACIVASNQIAGGTSVDANLSFWSAATFGGDAEVFFTVATRNEGVQFGQFLRTTTLNVSTFDGYYAESTPVAGSNNDTHFIARVDNGTVTQLGSSFTQEFANGDSLGMEAIGSTIKLYRKPSAGSWSDISSGGRTDSTYSSAGYIGVNIVHDVTRLDDFGGGTVSAGGTQYEQSAAGSLTPSGVIVRKPAKALAGSITPTGALSRQAGKVAAGSLAPSGVLSRMAGKILSGALAPSGALQTAIIKAVSIAGSLGLAGALSRMAGKALSGSVAPSGGVTRQAGKTLSGSITPTGAASRQTGKSLAGSITPSGALNTAVVRLLSLAGSLGLAGGLVRQTNKAIAGGTSPSGALVRQIGKSLAGALTPAGALVAEKIAGVIQVAVSGTLALSGALSRATSKGLAGVLTPAGGIAKRINKSIAGALSLAGSLVRQLLNIPVPASRIYAINGEDRVFAAVHEDRVFAVLRNVLTYVVTNEDRSFAILDEDRTLAIGE